MNSLLSRVDITRSLEKLLIHVAKSYKLGNVESHSILPDGYQELNILLSTTTGRFVIKIFSKEKSLKRIQDNIWGYTTFYKQGIPMPALRKTIDDEYLFPLAGKRKTSYLCVMEFFNGQYLQPDKATDLDLQHLTDYMVRIHTNTHHIGRYYDTMGIANFMAQFKKFNRYLSNPDHQLLSSVVAQFSSLPIKQFRKCILHGTFESENVLKHGEKLCLLDLGCMDFNAAVYDLATFLSNFTLNLPLNEKLRRLSIITKQYQQTLPLSQNEIEALPTLVRVQYATIYLRTNYYQTKLRDISKQTISWHRRARRGLLQWSIIAV